MKRREFLKSAGIGLAASTAVAAPAIAQSMPEIKWRMPTSWPKSLDTLYGGCEYFAKRIAEMSDNKFQIQVFAAGEIVPGLQVLDAVQNGTVEMGNTASYYYLGKDAAFTFRRHFPSASTRQMNAGCASARPEHPEQLWPNNSSASRPAAPARRWAASSARRSRRQRPEGTEIPRRRLRRTILRGSAVPQQLGAGDIYPALEKGTIDAAEWVGPYDDEKLGFVKVAQYYYYPGWWEGCGQSHNLINLAKWNELPKVYQSMIQVASGEAWGSVVSKYDYSNPAALKKLISQGAVLRPFPQPVLEACYNAAQEVYAEHNKTNPMFKKLHDSLTSFKNDRRWNQVAELGLTVYDADAHPHRCGGANGRRRAPGRPPGIC